MFRQSYNHFIDKLHRGEVVASDLYAVVPTGSLLKMMFSSIASFSIWPFYWTLLVMIWLAKIILF